MFFAFLNKEKADCLDISALLTFPPAKLLYYYYNSVVKIPWEYYWEIKETADNSSEVTNPCREWLELFDQELNAESDLCDLSDSEFVDLIGPYYYLPSNTRFYFGKNFLNDLTVLSDGDLANMATLTNISPLNKEVQAYGKGKKTKHKASKGKDELLKDINLCLISLREIEQLNKQINFWEKILENRCSLRKQENLFPAEPDILPEKPEAPAESETPNNILPFTHLLPRQKKTTPDSDYSRKVKIYLIRYREYEKSCDRYKEALENWPDYRELFFSNCLGDIKQAEGNLEIAIQNRQIYNEVIQRSMIHSDYQDTKTLESFRNYLKTGRANELQECLNIFEEERNWTDIKASQERIENTIHFLQNSDPDSRFAYENINLFLDNFHGKGKDLAKAEV